MTSDWLRPDLAFRCCKLVHLARPNADLYHGQSMVYDVYGHPIFGTLCYENINPYENGLMTIPNIYIYIIGSKFWPRHIESKGEKSFLASAEKGWNMMEVNTSAAWPLFCNLQDVMMFTGQIIMTYMGMGQNPIPLVNIKIAGKWMFIPLKTVL